MIRGVQQNSIAVVSNSQHQLDNNSYITCNDEIVYLHFPQLGILDDATRCLVLQTLHLIPYSKFQSYALSSRSMEGWLLVLASFQIC
jgi:hypothetical protein